MAINEKQINELKGLFDDLGLTYTDQNINTIAYKIVKFVFVKEITHSRNTINVITKDAYERTEE